MEKKETKTRANNKDKRFFLYQLCKAIRRGATLKIRSPAIFQNRGPELTIDCYPISCSDCPLSYLCGYDIPKFDIFLHNNPDIKRILLYTCRIDRVTEEEVAFRFKYR